MDTIFIHELAVNYRVGVTEQERATPQRLLLRIEITHDCTPAAARDDLSRTIDYSAVCQRVLHFGDERSWKLIESAAVDLTSLIRSEFQAAAVTVEIQKFVIPEARCVGVRVRRP